MSKTHILVHSFYIIVVVSLCSLSGCASLNYLLPLGGDDRAMLQKHKIPNALYKDMCLRSPISLTDIATLSRHRIDSSFIIRYIETSGKDFCLSTQDVSWLEKEGVDNTVIKHLIEKHPPLWIKNTQGAAGFFVPRK